MLEVCIDRADNPMLIFWFITFDGKTINYTIKRNDEHPDLHEGLIIYKGNDIVPEEMTTKTMFAIQLALASIKKKQHEEYYCSSPGQEPNKNYIKAVSYLEEFLKVANGLEGDIVKEENDFVSQKR